jgi:AraC family transcriptional regulator of adaptative response / DNA-3-methyladenine glycosylase II
MELDPASCYAALAARDARFDGVFYNGVRTTGIYCRPICPARLPAFDRCEFFATAAEAERAGYRACWRCRPELAPGNAAVDARSRLARSAWTRIEAGFLNDHSLEELGQALGVTTRHLRRVMEAEFGISPVELAQTRRLALAKQLLQDTRMSMVDVAFAAGFASVRRFNALFQERFKRRPSSVRRGRENDVPDDESISLRLDFRPPLDWEALLGFFRARAIGRVEMVDSGEYRRGVSLDGQEGWVAVGLEPKRHALRARVALSLAPKLMEVVARLRALFDLDARPDVISRHLGLDPVLRPLVAARPGLRVPGAFDGFELAVRAVLGQQVSVRAATTICGRLVDRFGREVNHGLDGISRTFPTAGRLAEATVARVRKIGVPERRARTIVELARLVAEERVDLSPGGDPEGVVATLQTITGIGPWTAHYLAMRALRWPDAFPAGDLAVRRALGLETARAAERRSMPWRPWRAYAVVHLWSAHARRG